MGSVKVTLVENYDGPSFLDQSADLNNYVKVCFWYFDLSCINKFLHTLF